MNPESDKYLKNQILEHLAVESDNLIIFPDKKEEIFSYCDELLDAYNNLNKLGAVALKLVGKE